MERRNKIIAVARRELRIWVKRPIYLLGSLAVLMFCTIFYLSFLKEGVPHDLPIGVVDNDNSSISRNFVSQLDATQLGKVVRYGTFSEARNDMQEGKITSVCLIPQGFSDDINAQRQPKFTFYVNGLYFLGGSLAWKDILTMINLTSGAVQREVLRMKGIPEGEIMGLIRPVDLDIHQIGNPTMNYGAYLANMMLPGVLQMIIVILIIYSLGTELKYGTSRHLMERAGGNIGYAITGKLLVYTVLFTVMGMALEVILYHWMHFPLKGQLGWMLLDVFLLVLASEAVGVFIIGCLPTLRFALSVGSLYSVLGFSLTGFTLPVETMPGAIRSLSYIYPLRHYYLFYVQEGVFGSGFAGWWPQVIWMLCFLFLPLFVMKRLEHAYIYQDYERN